MKPTASKRIGRIEVKSADAIQALAEEERRKKAEALNEWRKENHDRLRWQMFLAIYGPESDWFRTPDGGDPIDIVAETAYAAKFKQMLAKYYDGHLVDFGRVKGLEDGAFCEAIELFYGAINDSVLLECFLLNLNVGDGPDDLLRLAREKITKDGLEWLQICYSTEGQQSLEESFFGEFLSEDFVPGAGPDQALHHKPGRVSSLQGDVKPFERC